MRRQTRLMKTNEESWSAPLIIAYSSLNGLISWTFIVTSCLEPQVDLKFGFRFFKQLQCIRLGSEFHNWGGLEMRGPQNEGHGSVWSLTTRVNWTIRHESSILVRNHMKALQSNIFEAWTNCRSNQHQGLGGLCRITKIVLFPRVSVPSA